MGSSFGRLGLGLVGAAIGSAFGMPAIGFAIGSALGGFLFPPEGPTSEGPRIGDTDVTASSLGKIIPFHYGVTRCAGNVFWSAGLKEVKKTENVGGKGGPVATNITYEYFASFSCAFGRGPAKDILRMWADGKLIYDATGYSDPSLGSSRPEFNFRFIKGGPSTVVDPLMAESINRRLAGLPDVNEGNGPQSTYKTITDLIGEINVSGNDRSAIYSTYLNTLKTNAEAAPGSPPDYGFTPSYKELCYIVFDDMPLEAFGNRIPNITAEIVWTADDDVDISDTVVETDLTEIAADLSAPATCMGIDTMSRATLVVNDTLLRRFSASSDTETYETSKSQTVSVTDGATTKTVTSTVADVLCADANGDFIVSLTRTGETPDPIIAKVANTSLDIIGDVADEGDFAAFAPFTMDSGAASVTYAVNGGQNGTRTIVAGTADNGDLYVFDVLSGRVNLIWGTGGNVYSGIGGGPMAYAGGSTGDSNLYWIGDDGTDWRLYKIRIQFDGGTGTPTVDVTELDGGALTNATPYTVIYDYATQMVNVLFEKTAGGGVIAQYDPEAEGTVSDPYLQFDADLTHAPPGKKSGLSRAIPVSSTIIFAQDDDATVLSLVDGSETVYTDLLSDNASDGVQFYVGDSGSLYTWFGTVPTRIQFFRINSSLYSTDLATVLADICSRTGMNADEYNVESIRGDHLVRGFTLARAVTGRKAIENLLVAYFVDGVETDWVLKFQNRSTAAIRTITQNELGSVDSPTGRVSYYEIRQPEYDLPAEIAMIFQDQNRDYQQGSAHFRRMSLPSPTMYSNKTQNIEMPLVLLDHEARDIAQRLMFLTWMSRDMAKIRLPWTHVDLDPTDVITINLPDGRALTDRISKSTMGANFELEMDTARSGDPVYVSQINATVASSGVPSVTISPAVFSKLFVLDIPLIYDYHDTGRSSSRYYSVVGSDSTQFLTADLYKSADSTAYAAYDTATVDASWGQVLGGALPAPRALWAVDVDNTITVKLSVDNGDISSTTFENIVNANANLALIYNASTGVGEMIQFQNVTDNGDGTITLDTLVRGRRGTDYAVQSHDTGEYFILLSDAAILTDNNLLGALNATQYFKAVSSGSSLGGSPVVPARFIGRDLMPYAPSNIVRSDDGTDLTVGWNRRTRLGGEWNMYGTGVEDVPLNEDSELYEIYILADTATALDDFDPADASTYLQLDNTSVTTKVYTAADLSGFGLTLSDTINVVVYQRSAQVGRGFPGKGALVL